MDDRLGFHLTGGRGPDLAPPDRLKPALFARFHDLTRLRYDFPLVLVSDGSVRSLSEIVDAALGEASDRIRRDALRAERRVRTLLEQGGSGGAAGDLSDHWERSGGTVPLGVDGELAECDAALPLRVTAHLWRSVRERKVRALRATSEALATRLMDLIRADLLRSEEGRRPAALRAGVGVPHQWLFDFEAMAGLLRAPSGASALGEARRRRIEACLGVLRADARVWSGDGDPVFATVGAAVAAWRERLPATAALVRAIAVAELEVGGRYVEAVHDGVLGRPAEPAPAPEDLALFPGLLVRVEAGDAHARAEVLEALSGGARLKVLVETDDAFGVGAQLATAAMGLGDVFVVQASSADLYKTAGKVLAAIEHAGPALISVYAPGASVPQGVAPYLVAAAATESRSFPTFVYDPSAGPDWAHRFWLGTSQGGGQAPRCPPDQGGGQAPRCPPDQGGGQAPRCPPDQGGGQWAAHAFEYADEELQRVAEELPFTPADLALCDVRQADRFARVPRERWSGLVPVGKWLADGASTLPCVYAVDRDDRLAKLVVDGRLVDATRRIGDAWQRLRELADIGRERAAAPAPIPAAVPVATLQTAAAPPSSPAATAVALAEAGPERDPDVAWIETPRCSSCNECTQINPRMFAYDENKQAYLKDLTAGTYRELVEAAESCQVAIIHPGKPRDPSEPGLDELLARAEAFR